MTIWIVKFFKNDELIRQCWTKQDPENNPTVILWNDVLGQTTHSEAYEELRSVKPRRRPTYAERLKEINENH
jgi:hypothetical protein